MGKWKNCKNEFPKRREKGNTFLSETVLVYDGRFHSVAFYDYFRQEWKDISVNSYISDMSGYWCYAPVPPKKIMISFLKKKRTLL